MKPTLLLQVDIYPWKIRVPWKGPSPIVQRKLAKDKNYEEKPKYTGKPPPKAVAKSLLKRPLGRPSVKSRVLDLRITQSRHAYIDFNIHRPKEFRTGLESRDNVSTHSFPGSNTATHMLTIPICREGIRSRITDVQTEMLKYDKSIQHMLIDPSKAYIKFLPLHLLQNNEFNTAFLEDELMKLLHEKCTGVDPFKVRILGLKTFQSGRILFAALTADLGMRILYNLQTVILHEIERKRRFLRQNTNSEQPSVLEAVHKINYSSSRAVHPCWKYIMPQINPYDHFQPHICIAGANETSKDHVKGHLLDDAVPYPAYASFINEHFGDEQVHQFELRSVFKHDPIGKIIAQTPLTPKNCTSHESLWLTNNVQGRLPSDLIARSSFKNHEWRDIHVDHT